MARSVAENALQLLLGYACVAHAFADPTSAAALAKVATLASVSDAAASDAGAATPAAPAAPAAAAAYESDPAVRRFREYIRIDTSHPASGQVDYTEAVAFWKRQAESLGLNATIFEYHTGKPIVVITWVGSDPSLPSIMLNSHMDVVAAEKSKWSHPPFDAYMDTDGNIYGRGTQDMKSVAIWYLEAIRQLMADNVTLARTIHMTLVPDEETGGQQGMKTFVNTLDFLAMNVGFALDEGISSEDSTYTVFYADRTPWHIVVTCSGPSAHGSLLPDNTAAAKFRKVIEAFLDYRESQRDILRSDPCREIGTVTSINLTKVSGGLGTNIIPNSLTATFDMRLAVGINETEFNKTVGSWIEAAGGGDCSHSYVRKESVSPATNIDNSNPFWVAFKQATDAMGLAVKSCVSPATGDMIRLRTLGLPALGFSPLSNVPTRMHSDDEFIPAAQLLRGVRIYVNLLRRLGNL